MTDTKNTALPTPPLPRGGQSRAWWRAPASPARTRALRFNGVQLVLNALWTPIFFGLQLPGLALIEIVLMWLAILATILAAWRVDRIASALLWPYLGWVSFAPTLNAAIWWLNR